MSCRFKSSMIFVCINIFSYCLHIITLHVIRHKFYIFISSIACGDKSTQLARLESMLCLRSNTCQNFRKRGIFSRIPRNCMYIHVSINQSSKICSHYICLFNRVKMQISTAIITLLFAATVILIHNKNIYSITVQLSLSGDICNFVFPPR